MMALRILIILTWLYISTKICTLRAMDKNVVVQSNHDIHIIITDNSNNEHPVIKESFTVAAEHIHNIEVLALIKNFNKLQTEESNNRKK